MSFPSSIFILPEMKSHVTLIKMRNLCIPSVDIDGGGLMGESGLQVNSEHVPNRFGI
jgi:hypothetical protein